MRFGTPLALWLLALLPLLGAGYLWDWRRRARLRRELGDEALLAPLTADLSEGRRFARAMLTLLSVALLVLAAARPQFGAKTTVTSRVGIDLVVALDTSRSMLARDVLPSRLERAKLELASLLDKLRGDRFGLVVFAGDAFVQCPLTTDYSAAKLFLKAVDVRSVPQGGTNIEAAIDATLKLFEGGKLPAKGRGRALVLITDGEETAGEALEQAKRAREAGVVVHTIGVGSPAGEPIPVTDEAGSLQGYLQDRQGNTVLSRLNVQTLGDLAAAGGGQAFVAAGGSAGIDRIHEVLSQMEKSELESRMQVLFEERFLLFLAPGLLALLAAYALGERRRLRKVAAATTALLLMGASPFEAPNEAVERGNTLFQQGDFDGALKSYDEALAALEGAPAVHFNRGNALAAKGETDEAVKAYLMALGAEDRTVRAKAYYNMGNLQARGGELRAARESYAQALRLDPTLENARFNYEVARYAELLQRYQKKKEEEQKKDEEQQDPQGGKDEQPQEQQKKDEEQQKQDEEQQDPEQQNDQSEQQQPEGEEQPQAGAEQEEQEQEKQQPQAGAGEQQGEEQKKQEQASQAQPEGGEEQREAQVVPITQQQAADLLDALRENEKNLQMQPFMGTQSKKRRVEKDW